MKILSTIALAAALAIVGIASAAAKDPVASPAVQAEFDGFIAKFRAALKANDPDAVAAMSRFPFQGSEIRDAAAFRTQIYTPYMKSKTRACLQRGKAVYDRDGLNNDNFFIFCGEDIFVFTRTPSGFLFTEIGVND